MDVGTRERKTAVFRWIDSSHIPLAVSEMDKQAGVEPQNYGHVFPTRAGIMKSNGQGS